MKSKILIFLLAAALLPPALRGQTLPFATVTLKGDTSAIKGGIVRSWTPTKAVVYYELPNGALTTGYFAIVDASSTAMRAVKCPAGLQVSDFRLLGDSLYFGGVYNYARGVLGCLDLSSVEQGNPVSALAFQDSSIMRVFRVSAYRNRGGNGVGVAAIGSRLDTSPRYIVRSFFMIEAQLGTGTHSCQYRRAYADIQHHNVESLNDVVVTDDFVAFVGDSACAAISVRRGSRDGFLNDPSLDTLYRYKMGAYGTSSPLVAAAIGGDKIAAAAVTGTTYGAQPHTAVWLFDLASMDMYEAQETPCGYKDWCLAMTYMEYDNTLLLLSETYDSAITVQTNRILYVVPGHSLPYATTSVHSPGGYHFECVDVHDRQFFVSGSPTTWILHKKAVSTAGDSCIRECSRLMSYLDPIPKDKIFKQDASYLTTPMTLNFVNTVEQYTATCIHP